ncbi:MAG: DUF4293 domain-containing protein [Bacteroidota bacterium]
MIQRIQTLFLAIASLTMAIAFFFPIITYINEGQIWLEVYLKGIRDNSSPQLEIGNSILLPLQVLCILTIVLAVFAIFLYKNRKSQMKMVRFGIVLILVAIALIFFYYANVIAKATLTEPDFNHVGIYLLLVSLIMFVMANRFILKDEKLVRAADRLR